MTTDKMTRREFVTRSAAGVALGAIALAPAARVLGANDRLSIGVIGTGGRGRQLMGEINRMSEELNVEITALCDVWKLSMDPAVDMVKKQYSRKPRTFVDYEDLLALDDVDAVVIATPDFHHVRMLVKAVRAGKDVYVEKPMAIVFGEAREALRAVEETGRVVQVGTQRRSDGRHRAGAEFIKSGTLGTISRVEASWNDCGPRWRKDVSNVKAEDIDWNRFLAGRKHRPFDAHRFREWQLYRDFTCGTIGLLGSHMIDVVHWFTDDPLPTSGVAHGGHYVWKDGREHEDTMYALFEYPRGFILRYCTGLGNSYGMGCYFYGTNGAFDTTSWKATGLGGRGGSKIKEEISVEPLPGENHMKNFLECVRSRKTPNADIYAGYAHSITAIMGARALRRGKKVKYDIARREMREG